jgi:hypothetical protein
MKARAPAAAAFRDPERPRARRGRNSVRGPRCCAPGVEMQR